MSDLFKGLEGFGFGDNAGVELYKKEEVKSPQEKKVTIKPEDFIYEKRYVCSACDKEFYNYAVRTSKVKSVRSDTDMRYYFEPYDPLYYDVAMCPHCGFTATVMHFGSLLEKQADLVQEKISKKFQAKQYPMIYTVEDAIERYKFALLNAAVKNGRDSEKAYICLKLSWLYRDARDTENEKVFTKNALEGFVGSFEKESFPICGMNRHVMTYLIGDLYRRVGDNNNALRWLGQIITSRDVSDNIKSKAMEVREMMRPPKLRS